MKRQLLTLTALLGLSLMLFSCSDDDKTTGPDVEKDVVYIHNNVNTYVYDEYDLDSDGKPIAETTHKDSLNFEQEVNKDGKSAREYKTFTNESGSYEEAETTYYSSEKNKLYIHSSVLLSTFGSLQAEGISLGDILTFGNEWFLLADAKAAAGVKKTIYTDEVTTDFNEVNVTADIKAETFRDGTKSVMVNNESKEAHIYKVNVNVSVNSIASFDILAEFYVVPELGIVKRKVIPFSFTIPFAGTTSVNGIEQVLVNYYMTVQADS